MDHLPREVNILTFNCWGLLYLSEKRSERLSAIARQLVATEPTPHIVALQEVWVEDDYNHIRRETRSILPYGKRYHAGPFGAGLVILSKWPIEESSMRRYPLNGRPTAFFRGDWFVGKGVACARIRYGPGAKDIIEVFNTHVHTKYEHAPQKDTYLTHRISQAWELAKLVRGAVERGHLAIALGDFNDVPSSLAYKIFSSAAPVHDLWRVLHPESSVGDVEDEYEKARRRSIPTAQFNIAENGATFGSAMNTWTWPRSQQKQLGPGKDPLNVPPNTRDGQAHRIDYIFASTGGQTESGEQGWIVKNARVGMLTRTPDLQCSLSDHFSVEATLALHRPKPPSVRSPSPATNVRDAFDRGVYLQSPAPSINRNSTDLSEYDFQLSESPSAWKGGLAASVCDEILEIIQDYAAREEQQKLWRGLHFWGWVLVAIVCYVGVWFTPSYASFVLMVLSTLGLAAGTADGLMSVLFFGTELRAIKELEWEITNAKAFAGGQVETWHDSREDLHNDEMQ
ncbi:Endonuclease/exonuclease/phosphatase [Microdochium trichocladiopsis]|uniref:Endonuclease/exonuclease/phosphatase n=1 Tax=Microdochium trichocladiopsis TaxID=1682393 RepID=A0A9P8YAY0_9PEZI|nr:Endonuclease/exonuclease/phosphatase [Microdochium trichocladiopsis]KAH7035153.1 Endonuclease/exonuclease/phosphatase [Microdochium trichocladiopsis]